MYIISFIKHFNISKDDFKKACEQRKLQNEEWAALHNNDINNEKLEIPNADIIYTFNNTIINEYYRRDVCEYSERSNPNENTIDGKYYCYTDFFTEEYREKNPGNTPFITFDSDGTCMFYILYSHGGAGVPGKYQINENAINVQLDLSESPFKGTEKNGNPYMDDKLVFEIIDNNHIVIGAAPDSVHNGDFYVVRNGDSFIRK